MTLPSGTTISLNQVNTELSYSSTATIGLNDAAVRTLFGISSGQISMSDGWGKSNQFVFSFAGGADLNLFNLAVAAGWNQSSKLVATNTGTAYATSTGNAALTVSGSFPGGVFLTNSGNIIGCGGSSFAGFATAGSAGGLALSVSSGISITNNGTIGGGGGGGGNGGGVSYTPGAVGFGANYTHFSGNTGSNGYTFGPSAVGGAAGGGAGSNGSNGAAQYLVGCGGGGGGLGAAGGSGGSGNYGSYGGGAGGAGGACTSGNGNITWLATGTRYGALN